MEQEESTSAAVLEATGGESTGLEEVMEGVGPLALPSQGTFGLFSLLAKMGFFSFRDRGCPECCQ